MSILSLPQEILRQILRISTEADATSSRICDEKASPQLYGVYDWPSISPLNQNVLRTKLSLSMVCRLFYMINSEFLYESVRIRSVGDLELFANTISRTTADSPSTGCYGLGEWVRQLVVAIEGDANVYDRGTAKRLGNALLSILRHCQKIEVASFDRRAGSEQVAKVSQSWWDVHLNTQLDPDDKKDVLDALTRSVRYVVLPDGDWLSGALPRFCQSGSRLRILCIAGASRTPSSFRLDELSNLTHLRLCNLHARDEQENIHQEDLSTWKLPSLTHLRIEYLSTDPLTSRFWSIPRSSLVSLRLGKLTMLSADDLRLIFESAPQLEEFEYFYIRHWGPTWDFAAKDSRDVAFAPCLRRISLWVHPMRLAIFNWSGDLQTNVVGESDDEPGLVIKHIRPFTNKTAFPQLRTVSVSVLAGIAPIPMLDRTKRATRELSDAGLEVDVTESIWEL